MRNQEFSRIRAGTQENRVRFDRSETSVMMLATAPIILPNVGPLVYPSSAADRAI